MSKQIIEISNTSDRQTIIKVKADNNNGNLSISKAALMSARRKLKASSGDSLMLAGASRGLDRVTVWTKDGAAYGSIV